MKTVRLIIGILSCALVLIVMFQTCTATVLTSMDNTDDLSGAGGAVFGIMLLTAGITAIAGRKSKKATIAASILYLLAALIGFGSKGVYKDLQVWSYVALGFGIVFIISAFIKSES